MGYNENYISERPTMPTPPESYIGYEYAKDTKIWDATNSKYLLSENKIVPYGFGPGGWAGNGGGWGFLTMGLLTPTPLACKSYGVYG